MLHKKLFFAFFTYFLSFIIVTHISGDASQGGSTSSPETTTSTRNNTKANDTASEAAGLVFEIIPDDKLCLLCHLVLKKFKEKYSQNTEQFKNELYSSCSMLGKPEETKKCLGKISSVQLKRLGTTSVAQLCVEEKLCDKDERPTSLDRAPPSIEPVDPIPEVKRDNESSVDKEITTQQQQLVEMYVKE